MSSNLSYYLGGFVIGYATKYLYDVINNTSSDGIYRFPMLGRNAYEIQDLENLEKYLNNFKTQDNELKHAYELFQRLKTKTAQYSNVTWDMQTGNIIKVTENLFARSTTSIAAFMNLASIKEFGVGKIILRSSDEQSLELVIDAVKDKNLNFKMRRNFSCSYST